jgi:hypothetical protein
MFSITAMAKEQSLFDTDFWRLASRESGHAAVGRVDFGDDGVTWAEGHLRRPELEHVVVCHAVHDICTHKPYSIPDLLRLNDFWVEAHLVCQHIIDQNGKRYNPN